MAGVYIHIPFCAKRCSYCDFHSSASTLSRGAMVQAIVRELDMRSSFFESRTISTIYIGGGTPTLLTIDELRVIVGAIGRYVAIESLEEFTIEANPEDITLQYAQGLKSLGINRLSMGVQSFNDDILRFFNRRHNSAKIYEAISYLRSAGFDNISIDLIYGVAGFDDSIWLDSLTRAVELGVEHISAYHLTIEQGSVLWRRLQRGEISQIDEEGSERHFSQLHNSLQEAGFEHYEVSNFAKCGYRSKHNSNYWKGVEYLGIGPSAHSYFDNCREWNVAHNLRYLEAIESGNLPLEREQLSQDDNYNEFVMLSMRCCEGVDISTLESRFSDEYLDYFESSIAPLVRQGVVEYTDNRYFIPSDKFLISDSVITELFR